VSGTKKDLTFFEATAIVTGYGVGAGVLAVPYLASRSGVIPFLIILVVGYGISLLLHLMIVEMMMRDDETTQLVELLGKYLFVGKIGKVFLWLFFILIALGFIGTLTIYIVGSGEILNYIWGVPLWVGELIIYVLAASVVFFGLKAVGVSEKFAIIAIALVILTLSVLSLRLPNFHLDVMSRGGVKEAMALFGMVMFSFWSFFSVPQAVEGLQWNKRLAPWAVICGIGITLIFIFVITLVAMGASIEPTTIVVLGWGEAINNVAMMAAGLFVILAMLTSFWSVSLALTVVLAERLNWGDRLSWVVATLPSLVVALIGFTDFLGFLQITGGIIAILAAILMVPGYLSLKRKGRNKNPEWTMGMFGGWVFLAIVILGYIMTAVANVIAME
jgi:amino acid permease